MTTEICDRCGEASHKLPQNFFVVELDTVPELHFCADCYRGVQEFFDSYVRPQRF